MKTFLLTLTVLLGALTIPGVQAQSGDLFEAARNNDVATAKQSIAANTDINKAGADGFTPLILASYSGSPEVVDLLLDHHAEVHTGSRMGNALMAASFRGYTEIVAKLLKAGARVNDSNNAGGTALMYAALSGRTAVVELLLVEGADKNARNEQGLDAAALAEQQGNQAMADLLRGAGKAK